MDSAQLSDSLQPRKAIAIFYPAFMGGGAEAVCLWMLEALRQQYDLTLFTFGGVDFARLDTMYGTQLQGQSIQVRSPVPAAATALCSFLIANSKQLRSLLFHWLMRYFRDKTQSYDLVMSAFNAMDMGRPGIQYIHWVRVLEGKPFHRKLFGYSEQQPRQNFSVANSSTVADYAKKQYGVDATVVFPPVVMDVLDLAWEQKEDAFICSGRLTPAKEPHKVIKILQQVREKGFDIKLHMTGGGGGIYEWKYERLVKKLVTENSSWITLYEDLPYKDYVQLVSRCRYGIHFKQEPFGISIAEMVKAGALPFVRHKGGQVEIVGEQNQALLFENEAEAVQRIVSVLGDSDKQRHLRTSLETQQNLFSTERFMTEIRRVVDAVLEQSAGTASSP